MAPRSHIRFYRLALLLLCPILLPNLAPGAVFAQSTRDIDHEKEYKACMALAKVNPEAAFEGALTWEAAGGDAPARHCAAVALVHLEQYEEAAHRLELLAEQVVAREPMLAAEALAQAGQAWSLADQYERALRAQSNALELTPDNVEILIDRSITWAALEKFPEAITDLNRAAELAPGRVDVQVFRASAFRLDDQPQRAVEDLQRAIAADPNFPEALLERGRIRRDAGNGAGARDDWLRVLKLVPKEDPLAKAAREQLEKLDVTVE